MDFEGVKYIVSTPPDFNEEMKYPTVIFMHGAGTRGDNLEAIYKNPFFRRIIFCLQRQSYMPPCVIRIRGLICLKVFAALHILSTNKKTLINPVYTWLVPVWEDMQCGKC